MIPPSIFNISSITKFDIGSNQIQGHLPSNIGITLPNIQFFSITGNQFAGSIPVSISNASNLDTLELSHNTLTGKVHSLEKLTRMKFLSLFLKHLGNGETNDLSFLCSLTNATNLTFLDINDNNFGGRLPKSIGNFSTTLTSFYLHNNKITGNIPAEIGNLINLDDLQT